MQRCPPPHFFSCSESIPRKTTSRASGSHTALCENRSKPHARPDRVAHQTVHDPRVAGIARALDSRGKFAAVGSIQ